MLFTKSVISAFTFTATFWFTKALFSFSLTFSLLGKNILKSPSVIAVATSSKTFLDHVCNIDFAKSSKASLAVFSCHNMLWKASDKLSITCSFIAFWKGGTAFINSLRASLASKAICLYLFLVAKSSALLAISSYLAIKVVYCSIYSLICSFLNKNISPSASACV